MTFPFLLVILGQPNYNQKGFQLPPEHSRRVKRVHVHPNYRRKPENPDPRIPPKEQMPIYDFALIEVITPIYRSRTLNYNFKFEPTVRPICLPSKRMLKFKFVGKIAKVSGYVRIEAKKIYGRHQNSMPLKEVDLRIIGSNDTKCGKVMFSVHIIIRALDCLVGRM